MFLVWRLLLKEIELKNNQNNIIINILFHKYLFFFMNTF